MKSSPVARGATWEEALKVAWVNMVGLIADRYDTTAEHANLIVGTIADGPAGIRCRHLESPRVWTPRLRDLPACHHQRAASNRRTF